MKQLGQYPEFKGVNEHEGLTKADIDMDGVQDIIGGGKWFKYLVPVRKRAFFSLCGIILNSNDLILPFFSFERSKNIFWHYFTFRQFFRQNYPQQGVPSPCLLC